MKSPHILNKPEQLNEFNPFKPLMISNSAIFIPDFLYNNPNTSLGTILRSCEMRALTEMNRHKPFSMSRLLTICFDCLGTYPSDEYLSYVDRKGSSESLSQEAMQFARQGGIVPYRYRNACQMCIAQDAKEADLSLGVLGLPVRQFILVRAKNESLAHQFNLEIITDGNADSDTIHQHEWMLAKISERNNRVRERIQQALQDILPQNVDELVTQFVTCDMCQNCLNICPICKVDFPSRDKAGIYIKADVVRWLISCTGCGVCEQVCPRDLPLSAIFGFIQQEFINEP
jgi:formate dehydrogenase subunit beta